MVTTPRNQGAPTRNVLSHIVRVLSFGVAIGAIASLFAIGFVEAIKWLNDLLFVTFHSRQSVPPQSALRMLFFLPPVIGGLIVGLLIKLIADKRPHGPADIIQSVQSGQGISPKTGFVTAAAALVGMGSGASVGQYGSLAHLGATIGSAISRVSKVEPGLGIGCGVAAAISTAFSAPIAGIIFAHEVVLRHYSLRAFAPITVASSTGLFIANQIFHRPALFEIAAVRSAVAAEFFAFVFIGASGALVAVLFMRAILAAGRLSSWLPMPNWLKPALAGVCVGITAQWIPEILGTGNEALRFAITPQAYGTVELGITMIAKILATALCLGLGFAGGVFSPALLIGVLFGAMLGHAAEFLYSDFYSGLEFYAICGMVAVTSPVLGAPLTTILIVFELTRNYGLTTAVMVSVVFSNLVAYRLFGRSLFDRQLSMRGFDLSLGRDKVRLTQTRLSDYLTTNFVRCQPHATLTLVKQSLLTANQNEAYIVTSQSEYIGKITLGEIVAHEQSNEQTDRTVQQSNRDQAREHVRDDSLCFSSEMSVWDAMQAMQGFVGESIAVLDSRSRLVGVVYESTLVNAYLQVVHDLRAEENATH